MNVNYVTAFADTGFSCITSEDQREEGRVEYCRYSNLNTEQISTTVQRIKNLVENFRCIIVTGRIEDGDEELRANVADAQRIVLLGRAISILSAPAAPDELSYKAVDLFTGCVLVNPVTCSQGRHYFEKARVEKWYQLGGGMTCPNLRPTEHVFISRDVDSAVRDLVRRVIASHRRLQVATEEVQRDAKGQVAEGVEKFGEAEHLLSQREEQAEMVKVGCRKHMEQLAQLGRGVNTVCAAATLGRVVQAAVQNSSNLGRVGGKVGRIAGKTLPIVSSLAHGISAINEIGDLVRTWDEEDTAVRLKSSALIAGDVVAAVAPWFGPIGWAASGAWGIFRLSMKIVSGCRTTRKVQDAYDTFRFSHIINLKKSEIEKRYRELARVYNSANVPAHLTSQRDGLHQRMVDINAAKEILLKHNGHT